VTIARTMMPTRFAISLALLLVSACAGGRVPTDSSGAPGAPSADSSVPVHTETVVTDMVTAVPPDAYEFVGAAVRGDTLLATVRYGGGCRTHEFRLVIARGFMESQPPQVRALIDHRANADPCKALITRELRFDLAPLRAEFRRNYPTAPGVVTINLLPPASGALEYRF
jgi:hypothetical protein